MSVKSALLYRFLGGHTTPVEFVRSLRPLGYGDFACDARMMVRHLQDEPMWNIVAGDIRPVLSRHCVKA